MTWIISCWGRSMNLSYCTCLVVFFYRIPLALFGQRAARPGQRKLSIKMSRSDTVVLVRYIRSGDTYNPDGAYIQKTVRAMTKFTSKPLLMGPPPRAIYFSLRLYHHRSASAKSAAALFFAPPS
jgi:hypothetical protein